MIETTTECTAGISERSFVRPAQLFLGIWVVFHLIQGLHAALFFSGTPADGPFHIFNTLRRIAVGQVGGRDFVFFHGIGVPYLHYPLFELFGANTIVASELSRQWTSILLFVVSLWAFARAALGPTSRIWSLAALCVMGMSAALPAEIGCGNSQISARSTMPILAFTALQLPVSDRLKAVLTGCCVALTFVFGTEHAMSLVLALFVVAALSLVQWLTRRTPSRTFLENWRFAVICVSSAVVVGVVMLMLLCGTEGAWTSVHYQLIDVPNHILWFYGAPPMPFLSNWKDFFSRHAILIFTPTYIALVALAWLLIKFWNHPLRIGRDWRALAAVMLMYGILSGMPLLGILSRHYVFPLARVLLLVMLLLYAKAGLPRVSKLSSIIRSPRWFTGAGFLFATMCVVASSAMAIRATAQSLSLIRHLRTESPTYNRFLDPYWNKFMTDATRLIDSHRHRSSVTIWSVWAGLLEWHYGVFHPAEDYPIAAGPQRWRRYLDGFRSVNPEFVTTMTKEFSMEEWLQNERWEFYEELLNNYNPLGAIEHAMIWQRKVGPWRTTSHEFHALQPEAGSQAYVLPVVSGSDRLGVVRVQYAVLNVWYRIPLLGNLPRYLATIEGSPRHLAVSFPPHQSEFEFPVQLQPGRPVRIRFGTASLLPGVTFRIDGVHVKILDWDSSQEAVFAFSGKR